MKKKITVLFLASILALSAAACNSASSEPNSRTTSTESVASTTSVASATESNTESTAPTESKTPTESNTTTESSNVESSKSTGSDVDVKNLFNTSYIDIVKDGKFYMEMTMDASALTQGSEASGAPKEITMIMACDAKNQQMYMDMGFELMGFQKMMISDGKQYIIDDTNKTAYYMETTSDVQSTMEDMSSGITGETEDITYVSDSIETFNGKECYAVVYKVDTDKKLAEGVSLVSSSGTETEQTYYFDKSTKAIVGIKVKMGTVESTIIIDELTKELPADIFTVPTGYTQTDMSSMMSGLS